MIRSALSIFAIALGVVAAPQAQAQGRAQAPGQIIVCRDGRVSSKRAGARACDRDGGIDQKATVRARRAAAQGQNIYGPNGIYNGDRSIYDGSVYGSNSGNRGVYDGTANGTNGQRGVYNGGNANGANRQIYGGTSGRAVYDGTTNGTTGRVYRDDDDDDRGNGRGKGHGKGKGHNKGHGGDRD